MKKEVALTLLLCVAWILTASSQNSIESIRKEYQSVHEWIARMTPNEEGMSAWPPEYFDLHVVQNLPATGPHHENIRMFYGELEPEEEGDPYPPHYLRFVTAKYNFAAREFYEEYLYDNKGQVMFIFCKTPEINDDMSSCELRMWFDGKKLLRFKADTYTGITIPEKYHEETDRCKQRAKRFLEMFKGIDDNTYL